MDNREQRKIVHTIIVDIVRKMLNRELDIKWTGRKIDLFEMIHIAYLSMEIQRKDGTLMYQNEMIRNLFAWQNLSVPNNERLYGNRLNSRRGVMSKSVAERMQYLIFVNNVSQDPYTLLTELDLVA